MKRPIRRSWHRVAPSGRALAVVLAWAAVAALGGAALARADDRPPGAAPVDFRRDVLPILSDKCFRCHGPDGAGRKADLRLDRQADLLRRADPLVVPGHADDSELVRRLLSDDDEERMPPPGANLALRPAEVDLLRRWVDEGATWQEHWAFVPPRRPSLPAVGGDAGHPVDRLVRAELARAGLAPSPEADRPTLIRRALLDLTGLPPTVEEVDAFLADREPGAFERVVDRALASPRHAERLATDWLDLARYADTHGYQADRAVAVWPWRDWVVRSFAANQRFDEFVTWQLAGDLLPDATREQKLATAFNRLHMQNEEGGIVAEEFRLAYVADRTNTMATAFLGLTFECARCHDHKFDPITQRDYYALSAFFGNIDESGQTSHFTRAVPVPTLMLGDDATDARLADLDRRVAAAEGRERAGRDADDGFAAWLAGRTGPRPDPTAGPGYVGGASFDGDPAAPHPADPGARLLATKPIEAPARVDGAVGPGVGLDGEAGVAFPGVGHFGRDDPFTLALFARVPAGLTRAVLVHHSKAPVDAGHRGYEVVLEDGRLAFGLHHMWPGDSAKVVAERPMATDAWVHVAVSADGSGRAEGLRVYLDGELVPTRVVRDGLSRDITYGAGAEPDLAIGSRFRDAGFKGGRVDEFRLFGRTLAPPEVADLAGRPDLERAWATPADALSDADRAALRAVYRATTAPRALAAAAEVRAARRERTRLVEATPAIMVMKELDRPRPTYLLRRGANDAPGELVAADTPSALPPLPDDLPRNRLGLARWLFRPDNPLVARVAVNRLWQLMFGRGIVETSENFGRQGTPPTHADLLDWLAVEFVESGWDVRHMLRLIATSATYRQSSRAGPDLLARDPANLLLARGPARRLTAEMLRDQALALAGLLDERRGGPPVRPYQPAGLYDVAGAAGYDQSHGGDLYRRSLYTAWKRTVPHPAMMLFDAADRNNCAMRRQATSTPLQALALLNDPQIVEAARHLAQLALIRGGPDDPARAAWMFRRATARPPTPREAAVLAQLLAEQRALFAADPAAARQLLKVGEASPDPALDPVELAAATVLAQALLNHDATAYRR